MLTTVGRVYLTISDLQRSRLTSLLESDKQVQASLRPVSMYRVDVWGLLCLQFAHKVCFTSVLSFGSLVILCGYLKMYVSIYIYGLCFRLMSGPKQMAVMV